MKKQPLTIYGWLSLGLVVVIPLVSIVTTVIVRGNQVPDTMNKPIGFDSSPLPDTGIPSFEQHLILLTHAIIQQEQYSDKLSNPWNLDNPANCSKDAWKETCKYMKLGIAEMENEWRYENAIRDPRKLPVIIWYYSQCHKPKADSLESVAAIWNGGHKGQFDLEHADYGERCGNLERDWVRTGEWVDIVNNWGK
jgi:hypothetical protein